MDESAASRLCTSCGMCCNGVLFEIVKLQPEDSLRSLEKRGMRINRKKSAPYFKQPCAFLHGCTCSIYAYRPTRCQHFECLQLKLLEEGRISEAEAAQTIGEAKLLVERIHHLLALAGDQRLEDPLEERAQRALTATPNAALQQELHELKKHLSRHFRSSGD